MERKREMEKEKVEREREENKRIENKKFEKFDVILANKVHYKNKMFYSYFVQAEFYLN